jgi:hypothetical protein
VSRYAIESLGHHELPAELASAGEAEVADVLRRAADFMGFAGAEIRPVASVLGGSCVACTDYVAFMDGVAVLVAKPALY